MTDSQLGNALSQLVVESPAALPTAVGAAFGPTGWIALDQASVSTFAQVTRDEQWIHTDPVRAATGPFGGTVAHGFFTLSMCSYFMEQLLRVDNCAMVVNYGLDRVRFPAPVMVGSRIRARGEIVTADARGDSVQIVTRLTVEADGAQSKPVCVADLVGRFYPQ